MAIAKRGIDSQLSRSESEGSEAGRGSTLFDVFSGFRKKLSRGFSKEMIQNENDDKHGDGHGVEMGEIFGRNDEASFSMENAHGRKIKKKKFTKYHRGNDPAPKMPEHLTDEDIAKLGPPPVPTTFSSFQYDSDEDGEEVDGVIRNPMSDNLCMMHAVTPI